ncbi:hypothetical protein ABT352_11090 [Streptosporangium sp. NPDC000563]|uniref:hypothetical protein n=1 Tax=unclassified Streptosporangium TaxID=2632669 RepID=UPI0033203E9F
MVPRDHELLQAARRVAAAMGFTPDEVMRRVVELGRGERLGCSSGELLLLALAQLAPERPISQKAGGRASTVETVEAPRLGVAAGGSAPTWEGDIR